MKVLLIRHFKVDFEWKKKCNYQEFLEDLKNYDIRNITDTKELNYSIKTVYISTLSRSAETAKFLTGEKNIIKTELINEIDFKGKSKNTKILNEKTWHIKALMKWRFNSKNQNETYKDTLQRVYKFLEIIETKNEDCIVVSHGMFLYVLMKTMLKKRYISNSKTKLFKNGEVVELSKL